MTNNDRLRQILSNVLKLNDLANSMIDSELYPVSFFSQAFDLIQKLQGDFQTLEAEQVEMFTEQLKKHQALILSIHQQMRHFSTQTQNMISTVTQPDTPVVYREQPAKPAPNVSTVTPAVQPEQPQSVVHAVAPPPPPPPPATRPVAMQPQAEPAPPSVSSIPEAYMQTATPPSVAEEPAFRAMPVVAEEPVAVAARPIPPPPMPMPMPLPPDAPVTHPAHQMPPPPPVASVAPPAHQMPSAAPAARPARPMPPPPPDAPVAQPLHQMPPAAPAARPARPMPLPPPDAPVAPPTRPIPPPPPNVPETAPATSGIPSFLAPIGADTPPVRNETILSEQPAYATLNDAIEKKNLSDLRNAFSLNDHFRFRKELFGGNEETMNKVIGILNNKQSLKESFTFLEQKLHWDFNDPTVKDFAKKIEKRFL